MGAGEITAICATLTTIALGFGGGLWQAGKAFCEFAKPLHVRDLSPNVVHVRDGIRAANEHY